MEEYKIEERRAVLVGVQFPDNKDFSLDMEELSGLCEALSIRPVTSLSQSLVREDSASFIGSGKVEEVREAVLFHEANLVIFQNPLSPSQLHNLTKALPCEVLDRTQLIFTNLLGKSENQGSEDAGKVRYA
ncbi:hypothetical protein [Oribacterium parvum]|uniref:HflX-like GTP-binding protein n=1 Tax=Oribacterium parvum TaxID=1501329 RepID=UPI00235782F4|nr:hypothetical protein [Oribacterium parvum]